MRILVVLVNYGEEQLNYLQEVVLALKNFKKYDITIMVNSNIPLDIPKIDRVNVFFLENYQLLPLTCRTTIWENRNKYDLFIYGENDLLFTEKQFDNFIYYSRILPKNRIAGLIRFEESGGDYYYPDFHADFDWNYDEVEEYEGKKFAPFGNLHQATFMLTKDHLKKVGKKIDFTKLIKDKENFLINKTLRKIRKKLGLRVNRINKYSVKCKVNTDVYKYGGMKKMICISDFDENLIHHLPNLYIEGKSGRNKLRSDSERMEKALNKLLDE